MAYQAVFKRYEMKYMMTGRQKKAVPEAMRPYMRLDDFGRTTIRNIYFDADSYMLARRSIEKPVYKEKHCPRRFWCAGCLRPHVISRPSKMRLQQSRMRSGWLR